MPEAWGAIGSELADAGLGLMKGLMGPSWADERKARAIALRKAELENLKLEEDTALAKARAAAAGRLKDRVISNKYGVWRYDEDTNQLKSVYEAPPTELKLKEQREALIEAAMVKRMGGRPKEQWTPEEITGAVLRPYWELLGQGRSPYAVIGDKGDIVLKNDSIPANRPQTTDTASSPPPAASASPPPSTRAPTTKAAPVDPSLPIVNGPPVSTEPLRTNKPDGAKKPPVVEDVQSDPKIVEYYGNRFKAIPQVQAEKEVASALKTKGLPPKQIVSMLEAFHAQYKVHAPGVSEVVDPAAKPPPAAAPSKPVDGTSSAPGAPGPGPRAGAAPSPSATAGQPVRQRNLPLTQEALDEERRKKRDQELQEIESLRGGARLDLAKKEAERHRLGGAPTNKQNSVANDLYVQNLIANPNYADLTNPAHRKLVDDVIEAPELEERHRRDAEALRQARAAEIAEERNARQERLALTGPVTTEQAAITARLFSEKQVKKEHYSELDADEKTMVNKIKDAPANRKEHQEALKLAQPMMDELAMLESTQYLTRQILPLLTKSNVGLGGTLQNFSNWAWTIDPGYKSALIAKAEAQLEKEGMGPKIDEALSAARAAAIVEGTDPGVMNSLHYTGGRSRLEALSALLIYAHAMAQKRIGAGTARGITTEDMKEARELFDPANWFATPDKMVERIVALQGFIQRSRLRKEEEVRQRHIDPATGYLVLKDYTIDQLSGKAPVAPQTPSSAADRLKQGPKKKTE